MNPESTSSRLQTSDILKNLDQILAHLEPDQRNEIKQLIPEYKHFFPNIPTRTNEIFHDVDIGGSKRVKLYPYRMQYLLVNDL